MTLRHLYDIAWRLAAATDLPSIVAIAGSVHPDYPERPAVFADRLRLHPAGMQIAVPAGEPVGYLIGHPWRGGAPLLDRELGALPADATDYWVHDVALLPEARGQKLGRTAIALLQADALSYGARCLRLAAVGQAASFWHAAGFRPGGAPLPACYGDGAVPMMLPIG